MKKRLSFKKERVISQRKILDPDSAAQSPTSIVPLAIHFPNTVPESSLNDNDDQWRSFRVNAKNLHIPSSSIPQYWFKLREIKDGLENCKYDILSDFMVTLTALPHSSACVERIFSLMNSIKTKCSNSLKAETVKDTLLAKQPITRNNSTCVTWDPSEQLVKEMVSGVVSSRYTKRMNEQKEQHQALRVVEAKPAQNEIDEDSEDMVLL
ncbi:eukaryotic translation initiation factor 4e [Plakobranchus ocellatus]|uniref:Eukaryotic translation initiation factor 4e n=1 Tax=Plakobranchus ocellatus TaxID=259542 RepID=A0AAV3ZJW0_9GAST|nr:eukaryotic translation initiation factor 4e [Plakobranchus ocellatus]